MMSDTKKNVDMQYSTKVHASYALGSFTGDFLSTAISYTVFKFYETEIFLPIFLISLAVSLYGIWNMINDPIAGYISDKNIEFMKRWGKRFTWFLITALPGALIFVLVFLPPTDNYIITFVWLLTSLCVLDTLFSFSSINWQAIFPDKFRSQNERTKVGGFQILYSLFGLAFGMLIPTLIVTTGTPGSNIESYVTVGLIVTILCVIIGIPIIYGMREDREMIDRTFKTDTKQPSQPYFRKLKFALQQKNFVAYLFAYLSQTTVMVLMLASTPYWIQYVLKTEPYYELIVLIAFLLASVASSPLWIKVARKYGNRIGYMCGTGGTATFLIVTMFIWNFPLVIVGYILIGISMGATWSLLYPCFSDVIDEIVLLTGNREEGVYYGFRTFIGRLSIVIQAITLGLIHPLTSFDPAAPIQSILAQWGIIIGMFAVPAFFYFIGFLCMWKIYDLKPEKVQDIKTKLKELNL